MHKDGDRIAVVTHGVTLKALFHIINDENIRDLGAAKVPRNTSLSIVEYKDKKFDIKVFSDISHLED